MANPRKFSEKIALHTQKQAEETAAFEQILQEVSQATKPPTLNVNVPQYRGGSLPNVNQISGISSNSIDLTSALHTLENMRQGRDPYRDRVRSPSMSPSVNSNIQRIRCRVDTSPYGSAYLSPPSDTSWRRTNSDSALHQSVGLGFNLSEDTAGLVSNQHRKMATLPERTQLPVVSGGAGFLPSRPPGLNVDQCHNENGELQIPMSNNTGSLPDLTNLHFQAPLSHPLDNEDPLSPFSSKKPIINTGHKKSRVEELKYREPDLKIIYERNAPLPQKPPVSLYRKKTRVDELKYSEPNLRLSCENGVYGKSPQPSSPLSPPYCGRFSMMRHKQHNVSPSSPLSPLSPSSPLHSPGAHNHDTSPLHSPVMRRRYEQSPGTGHSLTTAPVIDANPNNLDVYSNNYYSQANGNHIGVISSKNASYVLKNHLQRKMETLSVVGHSNYYYQPSGNGLYKDSQSDEGVKPGQHSPNEEQQYSSPVQSSGSPTMYTNTNKSSVAQQVERSLPQYFPGNVSQKNLQYSDYNQSSEIKADLMKTGYFTIPSFNEGKPLSSAHTINLSPHTPTSIPDIMVSDFSYATAEELQRQELVKDLGSAIASLSSSFESDLFPDEALKAGLDPIDLDGLQMLTDEMSCVTDPATEDNFRLDHLHK